MSETGSGPPATPSMPTSGGINEFIFNAANDMVKHLACIDAKACDLNQSIIDNRELKKRYILQFHRLRGDAMTKVTNAGLQASDRDTATSLARRASEVFTDPDHLKSARTSYEFVMSIGGIDKVDELKKKSDAIQDRKLDDSLLEYSEVLNKYKMTIGSVIMMVWSCGSKSFVRVVDQFDCSNPKHSTSIYLRLLVHAKDGHAMYIVVPITTINQHCTVATGANLQELFDKVCDGDNIKKLYDIHVANTAVRNRYTEHVFARAVVQ